MIVAEQSDWLRDQDPNVSTLYHGDPGGIGRLSGDHETVALKGTGLGPGFLLSAALVHGALATITSFVVYSVIQPAAKYARRALQNEILTSTSLATNLKPRVFYTDLPGAVLYVSGIPAGNPEDLRGILLYRDAAETGSEEIILARRASLSGPSPEDGSLGLLLEDGVIHIYRSQAPDGYQFGRRFGRYYLAFQPPEFIRAIDRSPTRLPVDMPLGELRNELREAARAKIDILREHCVRRASIEFQQRLALPLSCLLFAVLAVPLGMTYARSGKGASSAMSMAVLLIYWVVFKTLRDQASQGRFPAFMGVWGANLVMMGWAITAYRPLRHPHEPRSRIADALHLATATLRRQLSRINPGSRSTPTAGGARTGSA